MAQVPPTPSLLFRCPKPKTLALTAWKAFLRFFRSTWPVLKAATHSFVAQVCCRWWGKYCRCALGEQDRLDTMEDDAHFLPSTAFRESFYIASSCYNLLEHLVSARDALRNEPHLKLLCVQISECHDKPQCETWWPSFATGKGSLLKAS